jgi:hypothetical protein
MEEQAVVDRESWLKNERFLDDARQFMYERGGKLIIDDNDLIDQFLEQRRYAEVNEISMLRDLEYAQEVDQDGKQRFARLMDDFDAYDGEFGLQGLQDYAGGVLSAPSTIATGAVSMGVGSIVSTGAKLAGRQAVKAGLRQVLKNGIKAGLKPGATAGALRGAAVEGPLAAGQEELKQQAREEVGKEREEGAVTEAAIGGAVFGGAFGGVFGKLGANKADKVSEVFKQADTAAAGTRADQKAAADAARKAAKEMAEETDKTTKVVKNAQKEAVDEAKEKLRPLDKDAVAAGDELMESLNQNEKLRARLSVETIEAISIAAADIATQSGKKLVRGEGERITEMIARGIKDGTIPVQAYNDVLQKYHLTPSQFSLGYMADISDAAKKMQAQGVAKRKFQEFNTLLNDAGLNRVMDVTKEEIDQVVKAPNKMGQFLRGMDHLRLGMMTSQLATTVRNTSGGLFRLTADMVDSGINNVVNRAMGAVGMQQRKVVSGSAFGDATAISKFLFKGDEAKIVNMMFEETMPTKAQRLFFSAADAEAKVGSETTMAKIGHTFNVLNTMSDNIFKRAVFAGSLDRQLKAAGKEGVMDYVKAGKFGDISDDMIKKAMDDALDFTYQRVPTGKDPLSKLSKSVIDAHKSIPFLVSSAIPFPRFIANQLKFVHDHSIILPLLTGSTGMRAAKNSTGKLDDIVGMSFDEYLSKSVTGSALLATAVAIRANQPEDSKWNQYVMEDGKYYDLTPTLGPMAPFMLVADLIVRNWRDPDTVKMSTYAGDMATVLGTPRMAAGTTFSPIVDAFYNSTDADMERRLGKLVGDVASTYTIPVSMLRDTMASLDPDFRDVREMDVLLPSSGDGKVDFLKYAAHYSSRYMPVQVGEGEGQEAPMYSTTATGTLPRKSAIEKQLFGLSVYDTKTPVQRELDRLGMDRRELYRPDKDPLSGQTMEMLMGGGEQDVDAGMAVKLSEFVYSDEYKKLPSEAAKREALREEAKRLIAGEYRPMTKEYLSKEVGGDKPNEYSQDARIAYEKLSSDKKKIIDTKWKQSNAYRSQVESGMIPEGASIAEAGAYNWAVGEM